MLFEPHLKRELNFEALQSSQQEGGLNISSRQSRLGCEPVTPAEEERRANKLKQQVKSEMRARRNRTRAEERLSASLTRRTSTLDLLVVCICRFRVYENGMPCVSTLVYCVSTVYWVLKPCVKFSSSLFFGSSPTTVPLFISRNVALLCPSDFSLHLTGMYHHCPLSPVCHL